MNTKYKWLWMNGGKRRQHRWLEGIGGTDAKMDGACTLWRKSTACPVCRMSTSVVNFGIGHRRGRWRRLGWYAVGGIMVDMPVQCWYRDEEGMVSIMKDFRAVGSC